MTGTTPNDSPARADGPEYDPERDLHCEQLSALMDGRLSDDESRFLLRRMQHDAELAGRWERWQFYGDAMRGCAGRALPADFNRRVALAIAADQAESHDAAVSGDLDAGAVAAMSGSAVHGQSAVAAARRPLLRWGGGAALAASVAFAAIVGLRPDAAVSPALAPAASGAVLVDTADGASSPVSAASAGASNADTTAETTAVASTFDGAPRAVSLQSVPDAAVTTDSAPVAMLAAKPERAVTRPRAASADRGLSETPLVLATQPAGDAAGSALRASDFVNGGFDGDDAPLIAKPWPRSPLLQGRIDGGLMVDYGQGDGRGLILGRPAPSPSASPLLPQPSATPAGSGNGDAGEVQGRRQPSEADGRQ